MIILTLIFTVKYTVFCVLNVCNEKFPWRLYDRTETCSECDLTRIFTINVVCD